MNKQKSSLFNVLTIMSIGAISGSVSVATTLSWPQLVLLVVPFGVLVGIITARISKLEAMMENRNEGQDSAHNDNK